MARPPHRCGRLYHHPGCLSRPGSGLGGVFIITGAVMWFAGPARTDILLWMAFIHDVAFVVAGIMFFLHLYLSVFYHRAAASWKAMATGRVSAAYARSHHGK